MAEATKVIIIGAGIGGLAAGYRLSQQGYAVEILEASDRPGGRMRTLERRGDRVDVGAQFLHSNYRRTLRLIDEMGLKGTRRNIRGNMRFFLDDGSSSLFDPHIPYLKMLGLRGNARLWWLMLRYVILGRRFDMYRIDRDIPEYDLADGTTLCSAPSQKPLREFFLEPLCLGALDLMNLYQTVRWMRCSALSSLFTLTKGVASLTDELAKRLPVRLESPAARLVMEKDRVVGVQMEKDGSIQKANHVVMAVDPPSTAHLLPEVLEEQRAFFDSVIPIPYIMPVFFLDRPLDLGVWHYLNRPALRGEVMSATDQTAKTPEMVPSGKTIITVGLGPDVDPDPAHLSDESLIKMAQDDMEPMIPGFPRYVEDATVIRYPYMETNYIPGSCRRVLGFVERAMQLKAVSFVSDVFGGSFIESAILSAEAAVGRICKDLSASR